MNLKAIWSTVKSGVSKHSPEILVGLGIASMVSGTVMAVKATPKALILLEEKKKELETEKLPVVETVKTAGKCYIPSIALEALGVVCILGGNAEHVKRNAALATAYALSEDTLKTYQKNVIETIGENKEKQIQYNTAEEKMEAVPLNDDEIIYTGHGDTLCFDSASGRYFKSDIETIRRGVNELNYQMLNEMFVSLNDFYYQIGLPSIGLGEDLGWNINKEGYVDIQFSSHLKDGSKPCLVMDYKIGPRFDYSDLH